MLLAGLLLVDELFGLRRVRRKALPLPDLGDQRHSMFDGTACQSLKWVFQTALPAVAPLIFSLRSKVSDAGISPSTTVMTSLWSILTSLPLLALMTPGDGADEVGRPLHLNAEDRLEERRVGREQRPQYRPPRSGHQLGVGPVGRVLVGDVVGERQP